MKRTILLVALFVVVGTLAVPATGVLAQETENETETDGEDVAPGERLSGVVGVQAAEFDGEIERNAFRIALERADDNATKAGHIADKLNETEQRLAELNERKAELQEKRESGEMTEGQYRARTAKIATEVETVEEQLNRSNATAAELPAETLEANGVNATAIRTLQNDASELSGPEVAEIARSIAGDRSGLSDRVGDDRPGDRSAGDDRPGDSETADNESDEQRDQGGITDAGDEGENAESDGESSGSDTGARGGSENSGANAGDQ